MENINIFGKEGKWYKGNLHCHSTNSDGKLTPSEVAGLYKKNGYNFLAFTDHNLFTDNAPLNDENFLIIPGIEVDINKPEPYRIYHVVGIAGKNENAARSFKHMERVSKSKWNGLESAQHLIDNLASRNAMSIYCHPNWSRNELEDFIDLKGFFAVEIFNYGCEMESRTGLSIDYWDSLLRRGRRVWGVATDDSHQQIKDYCGGWVMIKAPELTRETVADSLISGSFYASCGPEIYGYEIMNGEVFVKCSPVKAIHFITYETHGYSCWGSNEEEITGAGYKLKGTEKYVRVECVDNKGNTAWTNPIFL